MQFLCRYTVSTALVSGVECLFLRSKCDCFDRKYNPNNSNVHAYSEIPVDIKGSNKFSKYKKYRIVGNFANWWKKDFHKENFRR